MVESNVTNGQPSYEGLSQYRPPLNYELAGRTFILSMDNGYDYTLEFTDGETVCWRVEGGETHTDHVDCLKADETTFFVNAELRGYSPRAGVSLVLDLTNDLATAIVARQGENPRHPFLVTSRVVFGAIRRADGSLNPKRHGYTRDMVGTAVEWVYSPDFRVIHVYCSERYYRVTVARSATQPTEAELREAAQMAEAFRGYSDPLEPAVYIRIKEGVYLFAFIEQRLETLTKDTTRGNSLAFLMNFHRMTDVGRSFGTNSAQQPENYTFGAYGRFVQVDVALFRSESPYFV